MTDWSSLDRQLRAYSSALRDDIRIPLEAANSLATVFAGELSAINPPELQEAATGGCVEPQVILLELIAFQRWMDYANRNAGHPEIVRAQVITQNYICFIYLQENLFRNLRRLLPSDSVCRKCCRFLTDNPVRALRNAFAHGNWAYKEDYTGLRYWARKGNAEDEHMVEWLVSQTELGLWQALARSVAYVTYTIVSEGPPS